MKCKYADFQFLLINMVIIIGSPKPVIVSRASETHCGPAKIDFGWPDWPAREKVKHDPCVNIATRFTNIYANSHFEQKHNPSWIRIKRH